MAEPDEINERYLARAIKAMNALGDELADRADPDDPTSTAVLGSGHPMADIMLLKTSAQPAEIQEGVAFFGRAGSAILKSVTRVGIDPTTIYGTNCAKCRLDDLADAKGSAAKVLLREIQITEPKIIVCMGSATADFLNRIKVPLAEQIDPALSGEVQQLTPSIETLVTPDIDESLDEESSKRRFWKAFQELGRWYSALPPY